LNISIEGRSAEKRREQFNMHRLRPFAAATLVVSLASTAAAQTGVPAPNMSRARPAASAQTPPVRIAQPVVLPGTPASAFATIFCQALTATNHPVANVVLRVRDARLGRIVTAQRTNAEGRVSFDPIDPGSYIIELIGDDQSIRATSQLLNVNAGESIATIVRLPSRLEAFAAVLRHSAPQAAAIAAAAAAAGVLAVQSTNDVSPR
jgi:hypothetical protein